MNYKEMQALQYKNGSTNPINEKLIKEEILSLNINGAHIEDRTTIEEDMELLALGRYFELLNVEPELILNTLEMSKNKANIASNTLNLSSILNQSKNDSNIGINRANRLKYGEIVLSPETIFKIKNNYEEQSALFRETAGVHSSSIFDEYGKNLGFFIDISRRNCLSKATGYLIKNKEQIKDKKLCIMLSSRVNSEMIKMFDKLGVSTLITKAAPSYDSVIESKKRNITLVGFLKEERFTIFCGEQRVIIR